MSNIFESRYYFDEDGDLSLEIISDTDRFGFVFSTRETDNGWWFVGSHGEPLKLESQAFPDGFLDDLKKLLIKS